MRGFAALQRRSSGGAWRSPSSGECPLPEGTRGCVRNQRFLLRRHGVRPQSVLATMVRAYPTFQSTVISAGLKTSRAAARRINAAASVVKEEMTGARAISPADRKTLSKESMLAADSKNFAKTSEAAVTDVKVLSKILRVNKLGGFVLNESSTEEDMIATYKSPESAFDSAFSVDKLENLDDTNREVMALSDREHQQEMTSLQRCGNPFTQKTQ